MDLIIWTYIFGGATIFGLVVAVFSIWNGRMTRRELTQVIGEGNKRTQEIIERGDQRTHQLLERMNGRMEPVNGRMEQLAQYMHDLDQHMQEMDRRHTELLSDLLRRAS